MDSFTLRVKTLAPATHELTVLPTTTVASLKQLVAGVTGVPAHRARLIWRGRVINDNQTLEELGEHRKGSAGGCARPLAGVRGLECNGHMQRARMHAAA